MWMLAGLVPGQGGRVTARSKALSVKAKACRDISGWNWSPASTAVKSHSDWSSFKRNWKLKVESVRSSVYLAYLIKITSDLFVLLHTPKVSSIGWCDTANDIWRLWVIMNSKYMPRDVRTWSLFICFYLTSTPLRCKKGSFWLPH